MSTCNPSSSTSPNEVAPSEVAEVMDSAVLVESDEEGEEAEDSGEGEEEDDGEEEGEEESGEESDGQESSTLPVPPVPTESGTGETARTFEVGMTVEHDFLGVAKVLKLHGTESWNQNKMLIELPPTRGIRRKVVERWVFIDALSISTRAEEAAPTTAEQVLSLEQDSTIESMTVEEIMSARRSSAFGAIPAAAQSAAIHRRRRIKQLSKPISKRVRRGKMGARTTKEPKVDPAQRVTEFPEQSLCVSNGVVFCQCCTTALSKRKSSVVNHVKGKQHKQALQEWSKMQTTSDSTCRLLRKQRETQPDDRGGCVPEQVQEFRFATVRTLLGCGIPLHALDDGLKVLLSNRTGLSVTGASDMAQYVPLIQKQELDLLAKELADQTFSIIFDGTTRVGEALAVVVRYCTEDFHIQHRLIALQTSRKHMSGSELCGTLIRLLVKRIGPHALDFAFALSRDSCSTNGAAVRSLKLAALPHVHDVLCFSHTLHNCAKHMKLEALENWLTAWFNLMAHTHRAKVIWKDLIDATPVLYSKVRWWSRMECANQMAKHFSYLSAFIDQLVQERVGDSTTAELRATLASPEKKAALQLDLAIMLDASIFCEKTYRLEGDRLELFCVVEDINAIREKGSSMGETMTTMPNVAAVLRQQTDIRVGTPIYDWFGEPYNRYYKGRVSRLPSNGDPDYKVTFSDGSTIPLTLEETANAVDVRGTPGWQHAVSSLSGAYDYLEKRLTDDDSVDEPYKLKSVFALFVAVRAFDPLFVKDGKLTPSVVDDLGIIAGITAPIITKLQAERHDYVEAAQSSSLNFSHESLNDFTTNALEFWRKLSNDKCPTWRQQARRVMCITPNSASSERVFSMLMHMFNVTQEHALSDIIETSIMLRFNKRQVG